MYSRVHEDDDALRSYMWPKGLLPNYSGPRTYELFNTPFTKRSSPNVRGHLRFVGKRAARGHLRFVPGKRAARGHLRFVGKRAARGHLRFVKREFYFPETTFVLFDHNFLNSIYTYDIDS